MGRLSDAAKSSEIPAAEMSALTHRLEQQYPDTNQGSGVTLVPLQEQLVGNSRRGLFLLWSAVTSVLLIACVNVAHLLLARSAAKGNSRFELLSVRVAGA